ncbi:hypothetical protein [Streptomyces sp. NPDC050263]|uniref:hypothetical protein n=1 Tax=Streptomyces sp. NPDC050263 TaxID=3155037 RepID=UPI003428B0FF
MLADDDSVLILPLGRAADVAETASTIKDTERHQVARMNLGDSFPRPDQVLRPPRRQYLRSDRRSD